MTGPTFYVLPQELLGGEDAINEGLDRGRELARRLARNKDDVKTLSEDQRTILSLVTLVHVFHEKIEHLEETLQVAAKDQADALSRLVRAKLTLDALREQMKGLAQLGKHDMGAGMLGAVDHIERALGTGEKSLADYVKESMSECSVKIEEIQL